MTPLVLRGSVARSKNNMGRLNDEKMCLQIRLDRLTVLNTPPCNPTWPPLYVPVGWPGGLDCAVQFTRWREKERQKKNVQHKSNKFTSVSNQHIRPNRATASREATLPPQARGYFQKLLWSPLPLIMNLPKTYNGKKQISTKSMFLAASGIGCLFWSHEIQRKEHINWSRSTFHLSLLIYTAN